MRRYSQQNNQTTQTETMKKQIKYIYKPNNTTEFFNKLNTILYILGLKNFWIEDVKLPERFVKIYDVISAVVHVMTVIFSILQLGSLMTQKNLTTKQQSDAIVIGICNPLVGLFVLIYYYYRDETREVFYYLAVVFKEVHNDEKIEKSFIKKLRFYLIAFVCNISAILGYYGFNGLMQVIEANGPFITVITAWPDVTDTSKLAAAARIGFYLFWCFDLFRISVTILILLTMLIGLSHQYRNLQSYFESLNNIFDEADLSHEEQESKYLEAFARGIKSHSDTIWCTRQCQLISGLVFTSHVLMATGVLIVLMLSLVNSKHDFDEICSYLTTLIITLIIMGFFMWNGGDITVEASKLPDAIYGSGWYNCYNKSSTRVRKLVVIAMSQAQQPIVLKAVGIVELSYDTYVTMIKSAYSVFSVFY